jgi:nucleotide-binding universal stress UspA family protein
MPPDMLTRTEYKKQAEKIAQKHLAFIEQAAKAARVKYQSDMRYDDFPAEAIVKAARAKRCDLIFMASHGRRGLSRVLMGSETLEILTKCKIPLLIYR